jgi:hypothetical protein
MDVGLGVVPVRRLEVGPERVGQRREADLLGGVVGNSKQVGRLSLAGHVHRRPAGAQAAGASGKHEAPHGRATLAEEGRGHMRKLAVDAHAGEAGHDDDRGIGEVMGQVVDRVSNSLLAVGNGLPGARLPDPAHVARRVAVQLGVDLVVERGELAAGLRIPHDDKASPWDVRAGGRLHGQPDALPNHVVRHGPGEVQALSDRPRRRQHLIGRKCEHLGHCR